MCLFISGTLVRGADLGVVRAVRGPEGSAWEPLANPHVQKQLPPGHAYFLVTGSHCDCRSALQPRGPMKKDGTPRMPKGSKTWSATKKARWMSQVGHRAVPGVAMTRGDVVAWHGYLKRLVGVVGKGQVGLLLHTYRGRVDGERITIRQERRELSDDPSVLVGMGEDVLYLFE